MSELIEGCREERTVTVCLSGMRDINEALARVVQAHEREFTGASMVRIGIEECLVCDSDSDGGWRRIWSASVSGTFEPEGQRDG